MNMNLERDTKSLLAVGLPDWKGCMADIPLRNVLLQYLDGLMTWEDFLPAIKPFCKENVTEKELYNAMNDVLDDVPVSRVEWILSLKKKYKVYLLSNICKESWAICKERFEASGHTLEECFDGVFLSYEMKLAKPDARIYKVVEENTGFIPTETLYYDDTIENIKAAEELGYQCIHVSMNRLEHCLNCVQ
ncbi:MAG: HAD-IA family hydrolase [Bacteroidaceae bacterium]|nr:HAD-IA family hydrolase [Bacteroidaceae bacterium]